MAKTLSDPRAEAARDLAQVETDRDKLLPPLRARAEAAKAEVAKARKAVEKAAADSATAHRALSGTRQQLDRRETTARAVLVATADPRVQEFIDDVQYMVSTRRNEFFGATPEGMQRWTLAIQRACDEARLLQCSPEDDGKTTALIAKWRDEIAAAEKRIAERSGNVVSVGDELSKAVQEAQPIQRTKQKHGQRYQELP